MEFLKSIFGAFSVLFFISWIAGATPPPVAWTKLIVRDEDQVAVNYWRASNLTYDIEKGEVLLYVDGYVSQKAYLAHANPVVFHKPYLIPDSTNPQLGAAGKAFLTGYVMAQPEFSGARISQ